MIRLILLLFWFFFMLYLRHKVKQKRMKRQMWDPFGFNLKLITKIECEKNCKCDGIIYKTIYRNWMKGDYVGKTTKIKIKTTECGATIVGIYVERYPSKQELKYQKLVEKWR